MELLREKDMATDVKVLVGGIVPDEDAEELKQVEGVATLCFSPGRHSMRLWEFYSRGGWTGPRLSLD